MSNEIELELLVNDEYEASVIGPREQAYREMRRYWAQYCNDGKCTVYEITRTQINIEEVLGLVASETPADQETLASERELTADERKMIERGLRRFLAAVPCDLPPEGWKCTRGKGHEGPCAALETSSGAQMDTSNASSVTQQEIVSAIHQHAKAIARLTELWPAEIGTSL